MDKPQDAGKYQVSNDGTMQGQVIGDNPTVHQHFHNAGDKTISSTTPERVWTIPFARNPLFLGQDDLLTRLHTHLKRGATTALTQAHAISGLGGIGKTQIAIEYAYRYRDSYPFVFWVRAEHHETMISDLVSLASLLQLPEQHEPNQTKVAIAVKQWLATHQGWLLIFDNADDLSLLSPFLPEQHTGAIVLTTRASQTQPLAKPLQVEEMDEQTGAAFVLRRARLLRPDQSLEEALPEDQQTARKLCQLVGGLPLALDQAGAYIDETQCRIQDYLKFYQRDQQVRAKLLQSRGKVTAGHPEPVATTWALAFAKVEQTSTAAADLLRACAFLAPDLIPEDLLRQGARYWGASLENVAGDDFLWNETIGELLKYALVKRSREHQVLSIHRMVQTVLKDAMDEQNQHQWAERTVCAVNAAFPDVNFAQWQQCERCLPHALVCADLIERESLMLEEAAHLLNEAGYYLHERGRYREAEPLLKHALAIREQQLGPEHPDTARSLNDLASLYWAQGKYEQAEPLFLRALEIREKQLRPEHPDTARSLNDLASLYWAQGKYEQAEPLFLRALEIREKQLGPEHPDTARSLNDLAELYYTQGKYEQAKPPHQRALKIREKQLGPEHPDTARSLNDLASLYWAQGKYEQAEPLYQRALEIREKQLGPQHPDTATSLDSLAGLYYTQGKYEQAEPLSLRALEIREKQLGPEHPDTATSLDILAGLYYTQGKYEQAEPLSLRALEIREKQLGADHPQTAGSLNNLASLYYNQGKYEQAKPLHQRALSIREKHLGHEHPDTAQSLHWLAYLYQHQKNYEQSEPLYQRAIAIYEKALGPQHPSTQQTRQNYATLLRTMGRNEEAKQLEEGNES